MPIFEYRCKQCEHVTAFLEKAGARGRRICESCGSSATEKALSTFAPQAGRSGSTRCQTCPTGPSCPAARPRG